MAVNFAVTYHGITKKEQDEHAQDQEEIQPITFHTDALLSTSRNWLYRLNENNLWEGCANDEAWGCGGNNIGMDEDLIVNISEDQGFVSLQPGGSWTFSYPTDHPDDEAIGDAFSYQFKGLHACLIR